MQSNNIKKPLRSESKAKSSSLKKLRFLFLVIVLALIGFEIYSLLPKSLLNSSKSKSIDAYAQELMQKCKGKKAYDRCYDPEIPKLLGKISMAQAFELTKKIQEQDDTLAYCHTTAHKISSRQVSMDPSRWKEIIAECPPQGTCSNGCMHGALQERFRTEYMSDEQIKKVLPDILSICESEVIETSRARASCFHGLGHLTMYMTKGNVDKSLAICEAIKNDPGLDLQHICFSGAFMQLYQPLEPEDFVLIKGHEATRENVDALCSKYSGNQKVACFTESWPLFYSEIMTPEGSVSFCDKVDSESQDWCYQMTFHTVAIRNNLDFDKNMEFCTNIASEKRPTCFARIAEEVLDGGGYEKIPLAVKMCSYASKMNSEEACFKQLFSYASFSYKSGGRELDALCKAVPDNWKRKCEALAISK